MRSAGALATLIIAGVVALSGNRDGVLRDWSQSALLVGLVLVSLGLVLFRYRREIDPAGRCLRRILGWGPWIRCRTVDLATATCIDLGVPEIDADHETRFPVLAVSREGPHRLACVDDRHQARRLARRIALALGLPLGPGASPTGMLVSCDDVDRPLRETVQINPEDLVTPRETTVQVTPGPDGIAIRLPPRRRAGLVVVLPALVCLGAAGWFAWSAADGWFSHPVTPARWLVAAQVLMPAIVGLAFLGMAFRTGLRPTRVQATRHGLRIGRHRVAVDDLRGLVIGAGRSGAGITVLTDRQDFRLAEGASPADLHWIRALILAALFPDRAPAAGTARLSPA